MFLSLIFMLLVSFVGAMVESASISLAKSMNQADLMLAMESMFAEYHPQLFEQYGIFAKQGSSLTSISQRLAYYGAGNLKHQIQQIELLSDHAGQEFYRQAIECVGGNVKELDISTENPYEDEQQNVKEEMEALLEESGEEILQFQAVGSSYILAFILPKENTISSRSIDCSVLPSQRELKRGEGDGSEVEKTITGKWFFVTYLMEHFYNYSNQQNANTLLYETEYLLAGKNSDEANLEWVAKKLLSIRIAANYGYLLTDETKKAEADVAAIGLCALLMKPEAKEIVKQALLFFWAYGESILDLRSLYRGKRIPIVKSKNTWQLQLSSLMQSGMEEGMAMEAEGDKGVSYEDYLKVLLAAAGTDVLCMRALDLLEMNLNIAVDNCITKLKIESKGTTWREVRYTCNTEFAYQ